MTHHPRTLPSYLRPTSLRRTGGGEGACPSLDKNTYCTGQHSRQPASSLQAPSVRRVPRHPPPTGSDRGTPPPRHAPADTHHGRHPAATPPSPLTQDPHRLPTTPRTHKSSTRSTTHSAACTLQCTVKQGNLKALSTECTGNIEHLTCTCTQCSSFSSALSTECTDVL